MINCILINPDEFWLRGKNKGEFYKLFKKHIAFLLKFVHPGEFEIYRDNDRFVIECENGFSDRIIDRVKKIPGTHSIHLVTKTSWEENEIFEAVEEKFKDRLEKAKTFRVTVKRANKQFPCGSMEFAKKVGAYLISKFDHLKVELKDFDVEVFVKVLDSGVYLDTGREKAVGGLPVGTSGKIITMLSGGFDSPIASYLMSLRGCDQMFAFFHAYPFVGHEVKDKILELTRLLSQYQRLSPLMVIPFGEIQKKITEVCRPSYRTLAFRKVMLQASCVLAEKVGATALCTGDSLGQVSSQTLANISLLDAQTPMSIFRPLIGMSKREIITLAEKIGTFDTSVIPHDDACSMFAAKFPVTNPSKGYWNSLMEDLKLGKEIEEAVLKAEMYYYNKEENRTKVENIDWNGAVWRI